MFLEPAASRPAVQVLMSARSPVATGDSRFSRRPVANLRSNLVLVMLVLVGLVLSDGRLNYALVKV